MGALAVRLFGKLQAQNGGKELHGPNAHKVWELFAYLLVYHARPHARETLADLLWPKSDSDQARKYLRDTLWRLQTILDSVQSAKRNSVLLVDPDWIHINPEADLWIDVAEFDRAYALVRMTPGHQLDEQGRRTVQEALKLYRGDLLEGWYHDWCLFERERLQRNYLTLQCKMMAYCEAHGEYETGLECGISALRYDAAHERIHRCLMRLYYLAGDRTASLRQYERCAALLREELDVDPSERTIALYEEIRSDRPIVNGRTTPMATANRNQVGDTPATVDEALDQLQQLQHAFADVERHFQDAIQTIKATLNTDR